MAADQGFLACVLVTGILFLCPTPSYGVIDRNQIQYGSFSQPASVGPAETAAAAAQTAAAAAQTAAAAAQSAAQSAADAAATPKSLAQSGTVHLLPAARLVTAMHTTPIPHFANAVVAMKAATDAASAEKTAALAAASAASAATIADTAAKANSAATAAAHAASLADTEAKANAAAADAAKANAAASAAASALKAADSAANAAAAAHAAAKAAKSADKPAAPITAASVPSTQSQAAVEQVVPPKAMPEKSMPSTESEVRSPGVQVVAQLPQPISHKDLQSLPVQITAPSTGFWSSSQWWVLQLSSFIAGLSFAMVIKGLCVAGNVMVQVSPFPQVSRWVSRKCTGDADSAPYVSIAFGGTQWCFYGLFAWLVTERSGFLVLVYSNILGSIFGTYYTFVFYSNCRSEDAVRTLQKYLSAVSALVFLQVLRSKDSRSIPGPYACANFASCVVWACCGWLLDDPMVLVPALFSMCCNAVAISCKIMYPSLEVNEKEGAEAVVADIEDVKKAIAATKEFTPFKPSKLVTYAASSGHEKKGTPSPFTEARVDDEGHDGTGGTC